MSEPPTGKSTPSRRQRKAALRELLKQHDPAAIRAWARTERNPLAALQAALFTTDRLECRRVIEAFGLAAAIVGETDLEAVRVNVRQHFWMMNDESGNVGWHAPETIGEILCRVPALIDEFAPLLPAFFVEEPFERGTFEAVAHIAELRPEVYRDQTAALTEALTDDDSQIRAFAFLALSRIDPDIADARIESLLSDDGPVEWYDFDTGELKSSTVAEFVQNLPRDTA